MNLNENNDLKGNITIDSAKQRTDTAPVGASNGILTEGGKTFKDEFDKLLIDSIDSSMLVQSIGIAPSIEFEPLYETETYKYDTKTIENTDAMFFLNISSSPDTINLKVNDETSVIDASNYKTMEVSKTLGDLIIKSMENNKAVRLDFDDHVTVVLKVSKEGKIDTTFIPQNKEVENYLKNNIDYLKVRFDEQNIAYSNISYKPYRQNKRENKQGEKQ